MEPSFEVKPKPQPWTRREVLAWLAVVLLAVGIFVQHLRLKKIDRELFEKTSAVEHAAEKRMLERLAPLKDQIDKTERQVKACMTAVENGGP